MQALAGLGNPGESYRHTRHNAGWMLLDVVAARGRRLERRALDWVELERVEIGARSLWLMRPNTFMNRSGLGISEGCDALRLAPYETVVAYDDIDLPLGRLRLRLAGGAGGHRGLRSVLRSLGSQEVPRLRMGICGEQMLVDATDYVLEEFDTAERTVVQEMIERAAQAVEVIMRRGFTAAMNTFNASAPSSEA